MQDEEEMGRYVRKDSYYQKAKAAGLPSRASFKIEEIIQKFHFVGPRGKVVDLGAAPGGWTAILSRIVGPQGHVWAMDRLPLKGVGGKNISFHQGDIFGTETRAWLQDSLRGASVDAVCSDLSPNLTGIYFKDTLASVELARESLHFCERFLKPRGNWVAKVFPGEEFQAFLKEVKNCFSRTKVFEPKSTRKSSREVYVLGLEFKKPPSPQRPPKE